MTTTIIAYFPSPPRGVWHLWIVPIRAYALFIVIGIVAALLIGDRRWQARGGERGVIYDIALWAVPFGLIGGRLYHLATDWRTYFGEGGAGLVAALSIWDGGLGIWGAVALGGVGAWIACRRRGIPLPAFADAIAPGIVLAQAIGRLGNYFNQELYGRETTMPWGLEIFYRRDPAGFVDVHSLDGVSTGQLAMVVQPTFLYELLWNLVVFALLIYLDRRFAIGHGRLFALYVAGYCIGRFGIELLRDDAATHIAGIRVNSFTSTFVFIGAVVYLILAPKGREDPATLSASAADRLVPDSMEEAAMVSSRPTVAVVTAADQPVHRPAATETTAVEKPAVETEAIAAAADAAEADAPEVEVPAPPEQAAVDEPEPEKAAAEEPDGAAAEAEPEKAEEEPAAKAGETEADEPETEAGPAAEAESVDEEPAAEVAEAEADEPDTEAAPAAEAESVDEEPAAEVAEAEADEPDTEAGPAAEAESVDEEPAAEVAEAEADEPDTEAGPAAEAESVDEEPAAEVGEAEADEPDAEAGPAAEAESVDEEPAAEVDEAEADEPDAGTPGEAEEGPESADDTAPTAEAPTFNAGELARNALSGRLRSLRSRLRRR